MNTKMNEESKYLCLISIQTHISGNRIQNGCKAKFETKSNHFSSSLIYIIRFKQFV